MSEPSEELQQSTGVTNPMVLLNAMVEKGVDHEALKKMMDLAERWEQNQAKKAFSAAMQAAQAEMPIVVRDKENKHKSTPDKKAMYPSLEAVSGTVKETYTRHGFTLSFAEVASDREGMAHIICDVRHVGGHERRYDGFYPLDGTGAKGGGVMSPVQGRVSTMTYAKRDLKIGIFDITVADQDFDGENSGGFVGPTECGVLNGLFEALRRLGREVNQARFWAWLGVEGMASLPLRDFAKAVQQLERDREMTPAEWESRKARAAK